MWMSVSVDFGDTFSAICTNYRLERGEGLHRSIWSGLLWDRLCTENGKFVAELQDDGNFVVSDVETGTVTVSRNYCILLCSSSQLNASQT